MSHPRKKNTVIVICGATAVGKTSFAIKLARQLKTEIISADSRQCYKELNIGVAKPSRDELQLVPHHFINSHSIQNDVNAVLFEQYALAAANQIFTRNDVAVMVGGTGLYIKAFCSGLDDIPITNASIRSEVISNYEKYGIEYLQNELAAKDPAYWQRAEQHNPHRLMRALEVFLSTGHSITAFQKGKSEQRDFNICKIGLQLPKEQLYNQVDARVNVMLENGLLEEVQSLHPYQHLNALQTVGYQEIFTHLNGKSTFLEAVDKIKLNTRHYAKRQVTWFKKDKDIHWVDPAIGDPLDVYYRANS